MQYELLVFCINASESCKTMKPILDQWSKDHSQVCSVRPLDYNKNKDLIERYSIDVIPTYLLLKQNYEMRRVVGVVSKNDFYQALRVDGEIGNE